MRLSFFLPDGVVFFCSSLRTNGLSGSERRILKVLFRETTVCNALLLYLHENHVTGWQVATLVLPIASPVR
ncbi:MULTISPECIES: hypothetical protein [unclassified Acidovorax]|uniref:hypothetical protein n=1 Tax=unclassified Acidovorax TaxID=2684926 RepID=UPI0023DE570F|nr:MULTISPECIES: hypothetical protein [Comamonadaceae]WOI43884.1 hypothetical protein R1Z03_15230 [Paracidovorax avenae]GKS88923.1 hypothetical protein AVTE2539_06180 [Acidovorax sp. SUPP2539]